MKDWPEGYGRRVLDEVDSTNAEALRRAPELRGPEWILARRQTAGRGRRGRAWADPEGNFAATLLLHPGEPPERLALRSFVASLALFDAVVAATGRAAGLALKWPNDVVLNGGKLAGILLESAGQGGRPVHLAIGFGVNLVAAPDPATLEPGAVGAVSLMSATGADVAPETFLSLLAPAYARYEAQFTTYGFPPIRDAWLDRAARLGEAVTARTMTEEITGTFDTVDANGNLVLSTPQGRRAIPAADIFF
ncbi:biotin--[acetyl-CoA-carboxylase] ligase [Roseovarius sp. SCSIO 43702]|uniref:biotin--[acetyl-CoA-carboxylase] ligase n=1 Tax=Roseovarius sp. SCSIO 43702 TaxID=2823043 RepID=UPI001C73C597|nr:biotin--[acetyl-CoA-carboxylase] ligase [Roseovarius sp. SCSIO 43702]QYX55610.1 biotin--[acetyl-CoA-carboxylase] ligase [Roseovarius sp. SCSIO 43702]